MCPLLEFERYFWHMAKMNKRLIRPNSLFFISCYRYMDDLVNSKKRKEEFLRTSQQILHTQFRTKESQPAERFPNVPFWQERQQHTSNLEDKLLG